MKKIICLLAIATGLFSCSNPPKQVDKAPAVEETTVVNKTTAIDSIPKPEKNDNSKYYTKQDTVSITLETGETVKYAKAAFNHIVANHPEFFEEYPDNPDQTYHNGDDGIMADFGSEVGADDYYILYAYFLKQKNGVKKFASQRKKIIDIYVCINAIFHQIQHRGTFFVHQESRIVGYAEYAIYLLPKDKNDITKTYNITKQKQLYIQSLRQLIDDETKNDNEISEQEKLEQTKELNKMTDDLDKLITDNFYLRAAQRFHYEYYAYH